MPKMPKMPKKRNVYDLKYLVSVHEVTVLFYQHYRQALLRMPEFEI